ncbi:MFS transporter [Halomarina pelagica]|uniref:MFS transporter n=1 Tax=Halomarina pelagica TaxID=2961599 RepID=UPI0020C1E416|nr:MFS transporter [Halomarina sp. BND7]
MVRRTLAGTREHIRGTSEALRGDGRGWVLVAVATGWLLVLGTRVILPTLLPQVKGTFDLDNATAGVLMTVLWASYAVTQFPAGMLADRIGEKPTLVASVVVTAGGALALSLAPTFVVFVLGAILFGLGSGLYAPPRVTVLSRIYPDRDGTALGVTFAVGNLGASLLPLVAGGLAVLLGWRFGFGFVVAPLAVVGVALWALVPAQDGDRTRVAAAAPRRIAGRLASELVDPHVVLAWTAMTLVLFTYQGITAFLPTYLIAAKGMSQGTASALYSLFFASGAISQSVAGGAADSHGARRVLAVISGFGVLTLVALPFVHGLLPLAALVVLLGTRLGIGPVGNGYVAAILSDDVQGSGFGLFRTFYLAAGALGSSFVGVLAGRGLFDEAFLALAGITALSSALYLRLPRRG